MHTIQITDNDGNTIDTIKRQKIYDLMIHHRDNELQSLCKESGYVTYKGKRILASLEQLNGKQRWVAYAG